MKQRNCPFYSVSAQLVLLVADVKIPRVISVMKPMNGDFMCEVNVCCCPQQQGMETQKRDVKKPAVQQTTTDDLLDT